MDTVRSVWSKLKGLDSVPSSSRVMSLEIRPLDAGQKKLFDAMLPVVVSTKALDFGRQSALADERVPRAITITNPNRIDFPPVTWKALTNLPYHYCVRPNMGVLKSGDTVSVLLIRESAQRYVHKPTNMRRSSAFLIRSTPILEQWYPREGRDQLIALWKQLMRMHDHLGISEHKILANKPEPPLPSTITSGTSQYLGGGSDENSATELARLRSENAFLRTQLSNLCTPSASGSAPGLLDVNAGPRLPPSSPTASARPISECEWEDAAPSYEEAVAQEPPPRPL